jgi:hypothetical protein
MKIQRRHWRRIQSKHNTKTAQVIKKWIIDENTLQTSLEENTGQTLEENTAQTIKVN